MPPNKKQVKTLNSDVSTWHRSTEASILKSSKLTLPRPKRFSSLFYLKVDFKSKGQLTGFLLMILSQNSISLHVLVP